MSSSFTGGLQRSHWALDGVLKPLLAKKIAIEWVKILIKALRNCSAGGHVDRYEFLFYNESNAILKKSNILWSIICKELLDPQHRILQRALVGFTIKKICNFAALVAGHYLNLLITNNQ